MRRPVYIHPLVKKVIAILIVELVPTILGVVFSIVFENYVILESSYAILGVLLFLFALARNWNRDTNNYKANKTIVEDKRTDAYKEYKKFQRLLWILGLVNFALAYVVYLLFIM